VRNAKKGIRFESAKSDAGMTCPLRRRGRTLKHTPLPGKGAGALRRSA